MTERWRRFARAVVGLHLGLTSVAAGCGEERVVPATQLVVSVNSDLDLRTQLSRVEVAIQDWEGKGPVVDTRPFTVTAEEPVEGQTRMPFSFGVARGHADRFRMIVRGFAPGPDDNPRLVLQQTVISSFQDQQTFLLKIFLGSACFEKLCDDDGVEATCYAEADDDTAAGECGPIPVLTLAPLPKGADPHAWTQRDAGSDAELDASNDAGQPDAQTTSDAATDAAQDARPTEGGTPEAAVSVPRMLSVSIARDADDVTWVTEAELQAPYAVKTTERFHYRDDAPSGRHIEVANDEADETIGLRFVLPLAKGATVQSAKLTLQRFAMVSPEYPDVAPEAATMRTQVFDSAQTPPFVASHMHGPVDHAPIWATAINGFRVGAIGADTQSPELKQLVQHVLDRAEWESGASVTFVLSVDTIATSQYADFTDYAFDPAHAAKLDLVYTAP